MDEVPLPQRALLPLDDQCPLAREDKKVLLVGLPVVHGQRLAGPEDGDPEPELVEDGVAAEVRELAPALRLVPAHLTCVDDEPAVALAHEPVLGQLDRSFWHIHAADNKRLRTERT